ncbi:TetR family transcriptional regulator [Spirosoma sp. HMF4905]|uniref:TetR family transcriptional regulator n=1 Tax=Spirosoma arboris TaxID=2682092 RepID=A0A7K1SR09_9BACT|nr:TetR/AcrR family transcriptional regulator [Spirosoma arboris]MVM36217.1 TetR family transcriptional regulator [Spirosoma arboris]
MKTHQRNRAATTQRIVDAFEQILQEAGTKGLTINAIAEKADVSKVLIYRYFGSLEGLLDYYIRRGQLVSHFSPAWLEQLRPIQPQDLASIWSTHTLQLFRRFRQFRADRELLKASMQEDTPLAEVANRSLDAELTKLVDQLAFIEGGDHQAISAVIYGALSYLTLQAQLDRPVIGMDLRSEAGWERIEGAIRTLYAGWSRLAIESTSVQVKSKPDSLPVSPW